MPPQAWVGRISLCRVQPSPTTPFHAQELAALAIALGVGGASALQRPPRQWMNQLLLGAYSKLPYFCPRVRCWGARAPAPDPFLQK